MIRFISVSGETEGSWAKTYNEAIRELGVVEYRGIAPEDCLLSIIRDKSIKDEDIFLFGTVADSIIPLVKEVYSKNLLVGHAHHIERNIYESAFLYEGEKGLSRIRRNMEILDKVILNSTFQKRSFSLKNSFVSGFPVSVAGYSTLKVCNSICINHRFGPDKNVNFAIDLVRPLRREGYTLDWLVPSLPIGDLSTIAKGAGVNFVVSKTKADYFKHLSSYEYALSTTMYESLSVSCVEAVMLGLKVIAPDRFAFREFLDAKYLYDPYSIADVLSKFCIEKKPENNIDWLRKGNVLKKYKEILNA